jgi:histidine ammonia-lyase
MKKTISKKQLKVGQQWLSIEDIIDVAFNHEKISIDHDADFIKKINKGAEFLDELLKEDGVIYGVTTGYGDSCTVTVPVNVVNELPVHLTRFHGCGLGAYFSHDEARAIMAVRLCSLARGYSGVSFTLLEQIVNLLNTNISPVIPEEGSVGASGDLTPLSYLSAVLIGEREVTYQEKIQATAEVFKQLKISPYVLKPKEALAIMNGTAVMTALACEAFARSEYLCKLAARITAMATLALKGNAFHFDPILFSVKPHPGQQQIASWIHADLGEHPVLRNSSRLQDRYSIRCAPHIIGVLQDSLPWFRQMIENELNSSNDNPIIDADGEHVLHGGHFYGGHIATVMDTMKTQVANLADLLDRQMALLVDTKFNNGLPPNLSAAPTERAMLNHGFKAVQIGVSAWTAEALKNTMPASVFSRSTECHNQDKVSMGTIAARDCLRNLALTEQVFAALLLAVTQALSIRLAKQEIAESVLTPTIKTMLANVQQDFDLLTEDRRLDNTLREFTEKIRAKHWNLYESDC